MTVAHEPIESPRTLDRGGGVVLRYRLLASAQRARPVVVLLHGLSSNLTRWSEFVEHTALREQWDILRMDMRGHGNAPWRGPLSMEDWCEDLRAVLDAEGRDRAVIVGHSLGAHVAVHFAARHPQRTRALVLIDPLPREAVRGKARWLLRFTPLLRLAAAAIVALNRLGLRRWRLPPRDLRVLDERTRAAIAAAGNPELIVKHYTSPLADLRHFPTANYLQEIAELLRPMPLAEVVAPTLVLLSRGVTFTEPQAARAVLARFTIEEVPAFHWPLTEKPAEVRAAIERFCEGLQGAIQ
jgi:pimeloyl-ACP methyl ester carboxylesterase